MTLPLSQSRLEALLESANLLHASLELDELLRHLLRSIMGRLVVSRGLIAVEDDGTWRVALVRGLKGLEAGEEYDEARARAAGASFFVPIGEVDQPCGVVGIGTPASGRVAPEDEAFVRALAGMAATGIANARSHAQVQRLNRRLDQKIQELRTMLELVRALTSTEADEPHEIAHLLGLTLAGQWAVRRHVVMAARRGQEVLAMQKGTALEWREAWREELQWGSEATTVPAMPASALKDALTAEGLAVVFPLRSVAGPVGFVALGERQGALPFSEADLEFGAGLVAQAVVAFENAWHVRELLIKKQMERELALAASIQQGLFPSELPQFDRFDIAAASHPARQVGGDYYDALTLGGSGAERRCLLCVADVSGKGIAASLLMSNIQATLRALLGREASLAELARVTSELLYASTPDNKYVTAILVSLDPATGECHYVNAGHNEGLVVRAEGTSLLLPATGVALGMFPGMRYEEGHFTLEPGDVAVLYSDGVTEARNAAEEEYELARLVRLVTSNSGQAAPGLVDTILGDVDRFVAGAPQHDDITLMVLKRL